MKTADSIAADPPRANVVTVERRASMGAKPVQSRGGAHTTVAARSRAPAEIPRAAMRDLGSELGAPVMVCLEGGYDLDALAGSVLATVRAFGDSAPAGSSDPGLASQARERLGAFWPEALG